MKEINLSDWKKIPNLVSLFRIVFIPIIILLFTNIENNRWLIISTLVVFSLLDNLDGYLARRLNQITELGKVIDPLVDKLFVIIFALLLLLHNLVPNWFVYLVILRDLLILAVSLLFIKKIKIVPASDFIGKLTVGVIGIVFLISLLGFQKLNYVFNLSLYFCSLLIFISLINYGYKQIYQSK